MSFFDTWISGLVSNETVVLHPWGVQRNVRSYQQG